MTSQKFINHSIDTLVELFPHIQCKYEFDAISGSHYVEILPKETYELDDRFYSEKKKITMTFIKQFPYESITFLTEDDTFGIENIIYERKGYLFDYSKKASQHNFLNQPLLNNYSLKFPQKCLLQKRNATGVVKFPNIVLHSKSKKSHRKVNVQESMWDKTSEKMFSEDKECALSA